MVPSLPLLSCESSVSVKENPDRKKNLVKIWSEIGKGKWRIVTLTEDWAGGVLKSMNWVKRKGTTEKIEPSQQFLLEEKLTFQKKIFGAAFIKIFLNS